MSFLSVENIKLNYQTPQGETAALKDVSFSVRQGEFISIVGPSGCGKSTLLSCIAGLTVPTGGRAVLNGRNIRGIQDDIGYMLQTDNLLPWRNIYKNVLLGLEIQKKLTAENLEYSRQLLKKYGLWEFREAYPAALSGGMRQRAALIRTLAVKPSLLLLDEAFSALDFQTRLSVTEDVYHILKQEQITTIMVTHDIPEGISMGDRILILSSRPAVIREMLPLEFDLPQRTPLACRNHPNFSRYFHHIWKEMNAT